MSEQEEYTGPSESTKRLMLETDGQLELARIQGVYDRGQLQWISRGEVGFLLSQLQQTREELRITTDALDGAIMTANDAIFERNDVQVELEQVKAELEKWKESHDRWCVDEVKWNIQNESLRTELSAKNKLLTEFADGSPYATKHKARSILAKYEVTP